MKLPQTNPEFGQISFRKNRGREETERGRERNTKRNNKRNKEKIKDKRRERKQEK
jgi:hypothetical protein